MQRMGNAHYLLLKREHDANVEICITIIFENVSAFYYNENRLDGMRGRHSIWRRWGQY